jgi:hypothetical protein
MRTRYVAFGLDLCSAFRIAGMNPRRSPGLPMLVLDLVTPGELEATWDHDCAVELWRGRLGDGRRLVIERGESGDHLFSYGDHARFHLDPSGARIACVRLREGLDWQRALIGKVVPSIAVMIGYEALHAAAVQSPDGAVVAIAGPSGSGKSTLTVELLRHGWLLLTDDELTLSKDDDAVWAHPGSPHMNVALDSPTTIDTAELGMPLGLLAGERWIAAARLAQEPRPVRMVCLLERGEGLCPGAEALAANPLTLAPYMLGLATDAARHRARFALYADLTEQAALVRLTGAIATTPADLIEHLQDALVAEPALVARGAT